MQNAKCRECGVDKSRDRCKIQNLTNARGNYKVLRKYGGKTLWKRNKASNTAQRYANREDTQGRGDAKLHDSLPKKEALLYIQAKQVPWSHDSCSGAEIVASG